MHLSLDDFCWRTGVMENKRKDWYEVN